MSEVLVLQHAAPEGPGSIGKALARQGIGLRNVRIDLGDAVPEALDGVGGLLIMGGPMSVYEADQYPHLSAELRLMQQALNSSLPILGICLGSQLLAAAAGARVYSSGRKEIGWHEVRLRGEALADPLWQGLDERLTAFHWHGDVFDLPKSAVPLASSAMTDLQAFRIGSNAYGVLFHLEVGEHEVRKMVSTFQAELDAARIAPRPIVEGLQKHLPGVERAGAQVFDRWAKLVASRR